MKRGLVLPVLFLSKLCLADGGFLGTKPSGPSSFQSSAYASPVNGMAIVQLLVALAIVLLIVRYVLPKALTKFNRRLHPSLGGIRIEESASFAGGNLYVVSARSKTLLLATTGSAVTCLADLTEPEPQFGQPQTFQEMLDDSPGREPVVSESDIETSDLFAQTLARLDRLDRISQK